MTLLTMFSDQETSTLWYYAFGTYSVLLVSWLVACIPFEICDQMGWLQQYRIQPSADWNPALKQKALKMAALNWAWLPFALLFASPILPSLFPIKEDAWTMVPMIIVQFAISFIVDDMFFYVYHRALHVYPTLYKKFHKPHHVFTAPFAWTSHAVHPVEMMLQSIGAMAGPMIFGFSLHTLWVWLTVRQWQGVLDHIGYKLPVDPLGWIPGVGGTEFHDLHHKHFLGNYASCFSFIDDMMGTRRKEKVEKAEQ